MQFLSQLFCIQHLIFNAKGVYSTPIITDESEESPQGIFYSLQYRINTLSNGQDDNYDSVVNEAKVLISIANIKNCDTDIDRCKRTLKYWQTLALKNGTRVNQVCDYVARLENRILMLNRKKEYDKDSIIARLGRELSGINQCFDDLDNVERLEQLAKELQQGLHDIERKITAFKEIQSELDSTKINNHNSRKFLEEQSTLEKFLLSCLDRQNRRHGIITEVIASFNDLIRLKRKMQLDRYMVRAVSYLITLGQHTIENLDDLSDITTASEAMDYVRKSYRDIIERQNEELLRELMIKANGPEETNIKYGVKNA